MNSDIFCASEVEDDHECPYAQCPSLGKSMHIKGCPSQFYVYGAHNRIFKRSQYNLYNLKPLLRLEAVNIKIFAFEVKAITKMVSK